MVHTEETVRTKGGLWMIPPHLWRVGECAEQRVQHVERSRAAAQDHAGSQRKGQHGVRDEDDKQEVPHQLYAILGAAEANTFPEDACGSHRKHTRLIQILHERSKRHTTPRDVT
jgi:hypothetical protein